MNNTDVKAIRDKLNMTQQQLADRLGLNRVTIMRWERGEGGPSMLARRELKRLLVKHGNGAK